MGKNGKKSYYGRGRFQKKYRTTDALYRFLKDTVDAKLSNVPDSDQGLYYRFVAHVCASMLIVDKHSDQDGPFIPIYSGLIKRELGRGFKVHKLKDANVIEIKPESIQRGKSREFRLVGDLYRAVVKLPYENVNQRWRDLWLKRTGSGKRSPMVNLMTGQRWRSPVISRFRYVNKHGDDFNTPTLIRRSIKALQPFPFRPKKAGTFVNALERKMKHCQSEFDEAKRTSGEDSVKHKEAQKKLSKARGRLNNCRKAQSTILAQFPVLLSDADGNDPVYTYKAAYTIQKGGRLSERNGGFQSASKVFKNLCMAGINGLYNYDVKSSQAYIFHHELEYSGIKCPWLYNYVNGTVNREDLAESVGLSESKWKRVFYSLIMGTFLWNKKGKIYKLISKENDYEILRINRHLRALHEHFKPLIKATNQWGTYLYYCNDKRYIYRHSGLKHWKNACGMKFKEKGLRESPNSKPILIDRLKGNKELRKPKHIASCKRALSAFMLQGQEAAFIHHLTILCSEDGIPVYKNEHDGLITGDIIPQKLITMAGERSGFETPTFEIKPIVSKEKKAEFVKYTRT
ncbi:hypothetical protein DSCW_01350 [Desulfosarcina widdelii]|uniref:Uncharacterized protein n=1 Tax=Desulfosarcina widdelii TaxID=947919 RepID=A0A5K7YVP8_9BACT|nr:hypothetical protein [Desulfosarcina widdelii]BBO72718.1 hypothetical protein DSCW_01350 [Desulfosarcina widdelii]